MNTRTPAVSGRASDGAWIAVGSLFRRGRDGGFLHPARALVSGEYIAEHVLRAPRQFRAKVRRHADAKHQPQDPVGFLRGGDAVVPGPLRRADGASNL